MKLANELKRLGRHTAVYGLGGMVSRVLAVLLLPLYTHYLPRSAYGKVETITALTAVLAILLQLGISSAFFRFYFDAPEPATQAHGRPHVVLVHDGNGDARACDRHDLRAADRAPARSRQSQREPRHRRRGRPLGADELPAAHRALPRRGTLDRIRDRERHERPPDDSRDDSLRRRLAEGRDRTDHRQLHRDAARLLRARRVPLRAARAPVRPDALPPHAEVRDAARPGRARAVGDQLHRSRVHHLVQGRGRGRRLLRRDQGRVDHYLRDGRVPHRVARLRVLDRRRPRGAANVLVRADVPARDRVVGGTRTRRARAVVGRAADEPALPARAGGSRAARVRLRDLCGLHGDGDRLGPRAAHPAELGRRRLGRRDQHRPELLARSRSGEWSAPRSRRSSRTSRSSSG